MKNSFLLPILTVMFLLFPLTLNAISLSWASHGSIFYFAANNGINADPAPILPSAGFSGAWHFWGPFRLELTADIYFTNYEYNSALGYAMACNPENRSAFVMGFLTGFQLTGFIPIGSKVSAIGAIGDTSGGAYGGAIGDASSKLGIRVYCGPAVDLRLVTLAFGLNHPSDFTGDIETDAQLQADAIRSYFWSEGRWFFSVAGLGMDFPINEKYLLGFDLRTWFPVYRLWTDHALPAIDGWRFGAGVRITPVLLKQ